MMERLMNFSVDIAIAGMTDNEIDYLKAELVGKFETFFEAVTDESPVEFNNFDTTEED